MKNTFQRAAIAGSLIGMLVGVVYQHAAISLFSGAAGLMISQKRQEDRLQALQQTLLDRTTETQLQMTELQQKIENHTQPATVPSPIRPPIRPLPRDRRKHAVFIDSANFNGAARALNIEIDYQRLSAELIGADSAEINFYIGTHDILFPKQKAFLYSLEQKGYNIIRRSVQKRNDNTIKANLDVEIARDWTRMVLSGKYSSATLVSGDGDFLPLINDARKAGIHVTVVGLEAKTNRTLRESADVYTDLAEIKDRINRRGYGLAA